MRFPPERLGSLRDATLVASALAVVTLLLLAAFVLAALTVAPRLSEIAGVLAFAVLIVTGLLYAWRPPAIFDA